MAKVIVVSTKGYVGNTPLRIRPQLVSFVYGTAADHGWQVRVAGQRWSADRDRAHRQLARKAHSISDAQWAILMGDKSR